MFKEKSVKELTEDLFFLIILMRWRSKLNKEIRRSYKSSRKRTTRRGRRR